MRQGDIIGGTFQLASCVKCRQLPSLAPKKREVRVGNHTNANAHARPCARAKRERERERERFNICSIAIISSAELVSRPPIPKYHLV